MKTIDVDGKQVMYFNKKKTTPPVKVIKETYRRIQDDKNIPIMFMTREQYLKNYIRNQELKKNVDFPVRQEKNYIKSEMPFYKNVLSRYTTKKNKFFPPAVVFFNDTKIKPKKFKNLAFYEYGHELVERKNKKMNLFNEEVFCDKFAKNKIKRWTK